MTALWSQLTTLRSKLTTLWWKMTPVWSQMTTDWSQLLFDLKWLLLDPNLQLDDSSLVLYYPKKNYLLYYHEKNFIIRTDCFMIPNNYLMIQTIIDIDPNWLIDDGKWLIYDPMIITSNSTILSRLTNPWSRFLTKISASAKPNLILVPILNIFSQKYFSILMFLPYWSCPAMLV